MSYGLKKKFLLNKQQKAKARKTEELILKIRFKIQPNP